MDWEWIHTNLRYDDGILWWRCSGTGRSLKRPAGCRRKDGRYEVHIKDRVHLLHRVIYMLHHRYCPEFLDHIDRNPANNRIENLRPASQLQNNRNSSMRKDNRSGYRGVSRHKNGNWVAQISVRGKKVYLGVFASPTEAAHVYRRAAIKHFGAFVPLKTLEV